MNRREFVVAGSMAAVGVVLTENLLAQPRESGKPGGADTRQATFFKWEPVGPAVTVAFGQGGNSTRIAGKEVTYLVDTKNAPWGKTLRRELGAVPPAVVVINTHHHADHTGGNHAFTADCQVLAHEKCLARIPMNVARYISQIKEGLGGFPKGEGPAFDQARADWTELYNNVTRLDAKDFTPTLGVPDAHEVSTAGGAKLALRHFGPGHTDNDLVVHLPDSDVLVMGDLLFRRLFPYVDPDGGGSVSGWIESLKKAQALCGKRTRIVPGHGELCGPEALQEQIDYFEKSREAVARALKAGKDRKEVAAMRPSFPGYANPERQSMTLIALYNELRLKKD